MNNNNNHQKYEIYLKSDNGLQNILEFLRSKNIAFRKNDEERIIQRLRFTIRKSGLKNFHELLDQLNTDENIFSDLVNWLESGMSYNTRDCSFTPLVKRKKTLKDYANVKPKKPRKRRRRKRLPPVEDFDFLFKEPPDPHNIKLVLDYLSSKDINYQAYKENYFSRRLLARMKRINVETFQEYRYYLERNLKELDSLIDSFSINVTHFFRDKEIFIDLEKKILPDLLESSQEELKIWSAGCAVGCEPYSISMILNNILNSKDIKAKILGTDLSLDFLKQARKGRYTNEFFKETDVYYKEKYFTRLNKDEFQISSDIINTVNFKRHDLRTTPPAKNFDLITCRNVLIYFSRSQSATLFSRFYSVLKPRGYLIIGKCELLNPKVKNKFETVNAMNRVYRRID